MTANIHFQVIRSSRKSIAMRVVSPTEVEIRAPRTASKVFIDDFIRQHQNWLEKHLQSAAQREADVSALPPLTEKEIRALAQEALQKLPPKVHACAQKLGVTYGRITIRNQKSKWGSCSSQGNLNFNCLLMLCPDAVVDYVVAHELCHRKEMNHSPRFWAEVEKLIPDYKARRQWLKDEGSRLIARMEKGFKTENE